MKWIDRLLIGKDLTTQEAELVFGKLFAPHEHKPEDGKSLLLLLHKKGEHANELAGLVRAVRKLEKPIARSRLPHLVDACGTGGDGKHTFNISTIACLVASGAGVPVAKHGNRSISSQCGSSDLMAALGVNINASVKTMVSALRQCGFAYFHAPIYHPLFRQVQPLRIALGQKKIKTIFNLSGPLLNPLRPARQLIGVFRKEIAPVMARATQILGAKHAAIVWNFGGYDELTTTAKSLLFELKGGKVRSRVFSPSTLGLRLGPARGLRGGNKKVNRMHALDILSNSTRGVKRDTVLLNAAFILYVSGKAKSIRGGLSLARKSLDSGLALARLKEFVGMSHGTK